MVRRAVGFILLLAATDALAGSSPLSGEDIRKTVAGAVFEVDTPVGAKLPISYAEDGRMSAAAGALAYLLGSQTDDGRWWISSNRLCQKWQRWFDGAVHCLKLSQEGVRISWRRDDGESGTARIVSRSDRNVSRQDLGDHKAGASTKEAAKPAAEAVAVADEARLVPPAVNSQTADTIKPEVASKSPEPLAGAPVKPPAPVRASASLRQQPASRPQPSFRVAHVDLDDVLNVRAGPSAEHSVIGSILPDAAGIRIVGPCLSAWCPIQHRGMTGWVNSTYLLPSGP
jgi:hypothetical protein